MNRPDSHHLIASLRPSCLVLLMGALALAVGSVPVAHANSITVTSTLDTSGNPSFCTLRDAIIAANINAAMGGCPKGDSGLDTISFNLGHVCLFTQCTIFLNSGLPAVLEDLTINGSPNNPAISGNGLHRIFNLGAVVVNMSNLRLENGSATTGAAIAASSTTLTLTHVTLAGNYATFEGGAINKISGTLNVFNSTFTGNSSGRGAIRQSGGTTLISGSTFSGNSASEGGGVIYAEQSVVDVTASVFDGNSAALYGGAFYVNSSVPVTETIANSTFSNNQVLSATLGYGGGAIYHFSPGPLTLTNSTLSNNTSSSEAGALLVNAGHATLTNVTVSGNTAKGSGGGLLLQNNTVDLNNVTISSNAADSDNNSTGGGGGIVSTVATVNFKNSIITGNFDTPNNTGGSVFGADCLGAFTTLGYNLIGRNDGCTGFTNGTNGDKVGTPASPINALLGLLAYNGGATQTHALLGGSPARNAGNPLPPGSGGFACAAADQRGVVRPLGPQCDMGAYEAGGLLFLPLVRR